MWCAGARVAWGAGRGAAGAPESDGGGLSSPSGAVAVGPGQGRDSLSNSKYGLESPEGRVRE